jgi:hypothetical protein
VQTAPTTEAPDLEEAREAFELAADDFECDPTSENHWLMQRKWEALKATGAQS